MLLVDILQRELAGIIDLSPSQLGALAAHYQLLLRWNRKINLTTVTQLPEAALRHYCESLFLASRITPGRIVDVGSGAGFPGIPVAIALPGSVIDLVEAHQRKAVFLREAARSLTNVSVIASRVEALPLAMADPNRYDWIVSRAVDPEFLRKLDIADRYALLVGADDADANRSTVIPLPWGDRRVLVTGLCSTWNS